MYSHPRDISKASGWGINAQPFMGEIRYIIIAKQSAVGHPSRTDDVPCNLTQFCYMIICTPVITLESQPD